MTEFFDLLTDPAHLAFEVATTVILEGVVLGIFWPFVRRAIRHEHRRIDIEHNIEHKEPNE